MSACMQPRTPAGRSPNEVSALPKASLNQLSNAITMHSPVRNVIPLDCSKQNKTETTIFL